ncbi:hypothetical protein [Flavobacterium notoginsengisoli]|uniref:hypothetical protein n=1 Tax=Flavobacterium notoginsengisoli TaxID=1478199 RepID=UPI0036288494
MINIIKESKSKIRMQAEEQRIRTNIIGYLKECNYASPSSSFQVIDIKNLKDLQAIYSGPGFYILMTDLKFEDNNCLFQHDDFQAIYRGHSYFVKDRIMSHLFNLDYNKNPSKHRTKYTVCLKIEDGVEGININQQPYCNYSWKIIVHKMKDSSKMIREQAELAFDCIYNRPSKSKEK